MSNYSGNQFDTDTVPSPYRRNETSSNEQWIFGGILAGLMLIGFGFGVWAGAPPAKPKSVEFAEAKKEPEKAKPAATQPANPVPAPVPTPKKDEPEPEPKKPEPKAKEPEPEPKKPEPEPKKPDPKPVVKEAEPKKPDRVVTFKDVQPILRANCNECHGSAGKPKAGIDTTTIAKMLGSKGPPLVAGKPLDSTIYTSVKSGEMPPDGKKQLTDAEKLLLHDWILGGAKPRRTVRRRDREPRRKVELTPAGGFE